METGWTSARRTGILWAALLIIVALLMPRAGSWTIDDGVKRIAADNGVGLLSGVLADGPVRRGLSDPAAYPPLHAPFAERTDNGFAPGFSPWTRALNRLELGAGDWLWRLVPALAAAGLWAMLESAGMAWAFLLLPLTFYGLTTWEHALSLALAWPAVWIVFGKGKDSSKFCVSIAAAALAGATLLRAETAILAMVAGGFLIAGGRRREFAVALAVYGALLLAAYAGLRLSGAVGALAQFSLNLQGPGADGIGSWLALRPNAAYDLLLRMDGHAGMSAILLALLICGTLLTLQAERSGARWALWSGAGVLAVAAAVFQYRLWSSALPVLTVMKANGLFAALPWVALLLTPPYRKRRAMTAAGIAMALAIMLTPVWEGVHWGPRILLFALPLLVVDLYQSGRAKGLAFTALLALTLVQTTGSGLLVWARAKETSQRCSVVESKLGSVVICPTMSQCVDLAPLWPGREFFTAADPAELKRLLIELRFAGRDTVWMHLDAYDPLYVNAFPEGKPVRPSSMTVLKAGTLYQTVWRVYTLQMNRSDSAWAGILEQEAGRWMTQKKPEEALRLQREAVRVAPRSAQAHHNLALILAQLGQTTEARREADMALEISPELSEPRQLLEILTDPISDAPGVERRR